MRLYHSIRPVLALALCALISACGGKEGKKDVKKKEKHVAMTVDTALQSRLKAFCAQPRVKGKFGLYVYDSPPTNLSPPRTLTTRSQWHHARRCSPV